MSDFYAFASGHPIFALMIVWLVLRYSFRFYRQTMRSLIIIMHGYPPMWCDVDGDFPKREGSSDDF